jgi:hypothetical protein
VMRTGHSVVFEFGENEFHVLRLLRLLPIAIAMAMAMARAT